MKSLDDELDEVTGRQEVEEPFVCPECKKKMNRVYVYSQCRQIGEVRGTRIVDYGTVDEVLETLGIECPNCAADLMGLLGE